MKNLYIYKGVHIEWETEAEVEARKAEIDAQDEAYLALLLGTVAPAEPVAAESVEVETHVPQPESEADSELAVEPAEVDASLEAKVTPKQKKKSPKGTK